MHEKYENKIYNIHLYYVCNLGVTFLIPGHGTLAPAYQMSFDEAYLSKMAERKSTELL